MDKSYLKCFCLCFLHLNYLSSKKYKTKTVLIPSISILLRTFLLGDKVHEEPEKLNRKNKTIRQNHKTKSKTYIPHIFSED